MLPAPPAQPSPDSKKADDAAQHHTPDQPIPSEVTQNPVGHEGPLQTGSPCCPPDQMTGPATERLSVQLRKLAASAEEESLTLGILIGRMQGRVYTLLLVLLSLPFCQPIALPGLSTAFGVVIALFGLRFALRQTPWLPQRLLATPIPSRFLPAVLKGAARILGLLERLLHPRMVWLFDQRITRITAGLMISFCGLLLLLPLPIPFSNMLPALTVVLVAASVSERDGFVLAAGAAVFLITLAFFALLFFGGIEVVEWIKVHFHGLFEPGEEPSTVLPHPPGRSL